MAKKEIKKYSLPFVNDGKPFDLPKWTIKKHKEVLNYCKQFEKLPQEEQDEKYQIKLILTGLKEIDSSISEDDLEELHPDERIQLFMAVYNAGKKGIFSQDFLESQKVKTNQKASKK